MATRADECIRAVSLTKVASNQKREQPRGTGLVAQQHKKGPEQQRNILTDFKSKAAQSAYKSEI